MGAIRPKNIGLGVLVLISQIQNTFAQFLEKGKTRAKVLMNIYHQNSDDGNQVYDNSKKEEASVIEPMLFVEHQITEDTTLSANFVFDFWTAASDTKLDGQTGASGEGIKGQARTSASVGARKEGKSWSVNGGVGFSSEYDYRSINGRFSVERSFAKDNFTLGLGIQYFRDQIRLFQDLTTPSDSVISDFLPRNILATSLSASQILTRADIIQFSLDYIHASKNLESTASTVLVNGVREVEVLPDSRKRYALTSRWVHAFNPETVLNVSYRYYTDSWDLKGHTLGLNLLREINEDEDFLKIGLRGHTQTSTSSFQKSFSSQMAYMTSDSDLESFSSVEISALHEMNIQDSSLWGLPLEGMTLTYGPTVYFRSNGLKFYYAQASFGLNF